MGSFIECLCKRTLSNDINHLFCHRNVFKFPVRLSFKIVFQQGDMEKSVKTAYDIRL